MANAFTNFKALVGNNTIEVVTITADNGNGTSQAQTLSGTNVTIKGAGVAVGQRVFVRQNEILRVAPNLTITEVNV